MVKAVTLAFCSIQKHFIRKTQVKFGFPNSFQFPDIGQDSDGSISIFLILVNPRQKKIVITLELVMILTWNLDQSEDVMLADCDVIVTSPIYGRFGAIQKPLSGCIVCKTYIFINSNVLSCKNWKEN